jgi:hypothetical protein
MSIGLFIAFVVAFYSLFAALGLFPADNFRLLLCILGLAFSILFSPIEVPIPWRRTVN